MKGKIALLAFLLFNFATVFVIYANDSDSQEIEKTKDGWFSIENPYKTGIIFNVSSILLDVESYQGGIGIKRYFKDPWAYRLAFDFGYSNSSNSWLVSIGNTFEYHITTGRISPYIGVYFDIGYATYKDETDADNWTKVTSIPISTGPVLGVEIEVFNVLSLFAEYSIAFDFTHTTTTESVAGFETKDSATHYGVNTGLGNDSKIGIIIYFNRKFKRNRQ